MSDDIDTPDIDAREPATDAPDPEISVINPGVTVPAPDISVPSPGVAVPDPNDDVEEIIRSHFPALQARWTVNSQMVQVEPFSVALQRARAATLPAPESLSSLLSHLSNSQENRPYPQDRMLQFTLNSSNLSSSRAEYLASLQRPAPARSEALPHRHFSAPVVSLAMPSLSDGDATDSWFPDDPPRGWRDEDQECHWCGDPAATSCFKLGHFARCTVHNTPVTIYPYKRSRGCPGFHFCAESCHVGMIKELLGDVEECEIISVYANLLRHLVPQLVMGEKADKLVKAYPPPKILFDK